MHQVDAAMDFGCHTTRAYNRKI